MNGHAVLLVEDDAADVLFMRRAWKQAGITVPLIVVGNGEKVIEYLSGAGPYANRKEYPFPSLIVLDLKIPLLPGLEVLAWIRQNPGMKNLPVVVLTSSEEPGVVSRARELGISDYFVKPTEFEGLLEIVRGLKKKW